MNQVAEKLREARALIERGWTRDEYADHRGVCIYGALQGAFNGNPEDCNRSKPGFDEATVFLKGSVGTGALVFWNDNPNRTQAEVLAAFDRAIELAESGQ